MNLPSLISVEDPVIAEDARLLSRSKSLLQLVQRDVLITGASGMLGSYIVGLIRWIRHDAGIKGPRTYAVLRRPLSLDAELAQEHGIILVRPDEMVSCLEGLSDSVTVHAASPASPERYMADPMGCLDVNLRWTQLLAVASTRRMNNCFVYISSGEVYGPNAPSPVAEPGYGVLDHTLRRSVYAEAKRAGETATLAATRALGVDSRIARLFHTFGPGLRPSDDRVFGAVLAAALEAEDLHLKSPGLATRGFLYSYDAIDGIAHLVSRRDTGAILNVGSDEPIQIHQLADLGMFVMTNGRNKYRPLAEIDPPDAERVAALDALPNVEALRSTGWRPSVHLATALKKAFLSAKWRRSWMSENA